VKGKAKAKLIAELLHVRSVQPWDAPLPINTSQQSSQSDQPCMTAQTVQAARPSSKAQLVQGHVQLPCTVRLNCSVIVASAALRFTEKLVPAIRHNLFSASESL
jgi:hypothetical protein